MKELLRTVWRSTLGPIHEKLFKRYFRAIQVRQDAALAQLGTLQTQIQDLRRTIDSDAARLEALRLQVRDLDVQVRNALAARWDDMALARRMTALEERLSTGSQAAEPCSGIGSNRDAGVQAS